ncbi:hypothetical protein FOZ62_006874 [Perkinsus olseni]|uniref:Uncharacterized protein n=1 Tax=Perkinsus olseni TaxID=32597 RepID=A0A7J6QKQ1_PEROL|nr:hypothetical protein FOZ62_006874 [Perkinsus olseni]
MSHLLTLLIVASTYQETSFPPSKVYFSSGDDSFETTWKFSPSATPGRPHPAGTVNITAAYTTKEFPYIDWYVTGDIPYDVDANEYTMKLDTADENFNAFASTFDLDHVDWERIRHDDSFDMFVMLNRVGCYALWSFPFATSSGLSR